MPWAIRESLSASCVLAALLLRWITDMACDGLEQLAELIYFGRVETW